jgi:spore maturation protein SpmB
VSICALLGEIGCGDILSGSRMPQALDGFFNGAALGLGRCKALGPVVVISLVVVACIQASGFS